MLTLGPMSDFVETLTTERPWKKQTPLWLYDGEALPPFSFCFLAAVRLRLYLSFQVPLMKGPLCMVRPGTSYEGWQRAFVDFFLVVQSRSRGAPCQTGVEGLPICF